MSQTEKTGFLQSILGRYVEARQRAADRYVAEVKAAMEGDRRTRKAG